MKRKPKYLYGTYIPKTHIKTPTNKITIADDK